MPNSSIKAGEDGKIGGLISSVKVFVKNHRKVSSAVGLLLLLGIYLAYSSTQQVDTSAVQNLAQAEVTKGPIEVTVTGTGTIFPVTAEEIGPDVSGTVKKIYVQNGDKVKKGDVLLEVTNPELSLQLENARLELEKAALELGSSSGSGTITAPFTGRIVSLAVKTGDDVTNNMVLATLQNDSQLVFDMPVANAISNKVSINQPVEVFLPDRGETHAGKVISKGTQNVAGYNGENRVYLKVALAATGNLSPGTQAFGTLTIDGKPVDALAVSALEWAEKTQLKAGSPGKIIGLHVKEGEPVQKGQKLFTLDNSGQKTQELAYRQAELTLADLESQVADLIVKAPIDGLISGLDVNVGDEIGAATSVAAKASQSTGSSDGAAVTTSSVSTLGRIIDSGQMEISFPVDEVEIAKVKIGQIANITADALPEQVFSGEVVEIAEEGTVINNVSSFEVTIRLENPKGLLKSGMTANVTIVAAKKDNAVLIPIEALQERGERKFVMLPSTEENGQRQNMQPVTVGLINESYAEILEGVEVGEKILLPGQQVGNERSMMPFGGGGRGGSRTNSDSTRSGGSGARN